MALLGAALPYIGMGITAAQTIAKGVEADRNADFMAIQLRNQANEERAIAQREAIEARRQKRIAQSRALAVAGTKDKTVLDIMDDLETSGELNALNALYGGETRARSRDLQARNQPKSNHFANAAGTIISGASTLHTRFG